jgi:hypothetical protein
MQSQHDFFLMGTWVKWGSIKSLFFRIKWFSDLFNRILEKN